MLNKNSLNGFARRFVAIAEKPEHVYARSYSTREKDQPSHPRPPCLSTCSLSRLSRALVLSLARGLSGEARKLLLPLCCGYRCLPEAFRRPVPVLSLLLTSLLLPGGLYSSSFARHSTWLSAPPIFPSCVILLLLRSPIAPAVLFFFPSFIARASILRIDR